jgi:hypothetical protein
MFETVLKTSDEKAGFRKKASRAARQMLTT